MMMNVIDRWEWMGGGINRVVREKEEINLWFFFLIVVYIFIQQYSYVHYTNKDTFTRLMTDYQIRTAWQINQSIDFMIHDSKKMK